VARVVDVGLGDEHLQRRVLEGGLVMLDGGLELTLDPGGRQQLLELLTLGDVTGDGDLDEPRHDSTDPNGARFVRAPERTSSGSPRSGNGTTTTSKSRGTTVAGNSCVASSTTSCPK